MVPDPQREVIDFLASPTTYGGSAVERIDTHSAVVFLAGQRALKLKRAVRFDYLDFSTPDRRRTACEGEVRLNRRTAPALYRGVACVTRERDGTLALDGEGDPLDWCVDMVRFDQEALLDRLAARGALSIGVAQRLAAVVARFHQETERRPDQGGRAGMRWVVDGNALGFAEQGRGILPAPACTAWTASASDALDRHGTLLDRRRAGGFVRHCHGDLHLRNVVLLDGAPTPFDGVEFNDAISCGDVFYDLAFLVMDLWRRGLRQHANVTLCEYLARTLDVEGLTLLPFFLSCRAAVRAKTSATSARLQASTEVRVELETLAREYLTMANDLLRTVPPVLVAVGGLSGTGKSTLAKGVAPDLGAVPGAVVLRSDEIRKALFGVQPLDRLGSVGYAPEISARVYRTLVERARLVLQAGHSVIADAAFLRPAERAAIEATAAGMGVPFTGLWLGAPPATLMARVDGRSADASDADSHVVREQLAADLGSIGWRHVDASQPEPAVVGEVRGVLGLGALAGGYETAGPNTSPRTSATSATSSAPAAQTPSARAV